MSAIVTHPAYDPRRGQLVCALCVAVEPTPKAFQHVSSFDAHLAADHRVGPELAEALMSRPSFERLARARGWRRS